VVLPEVVSLTRRQFLAIASVVRNSHHQLERVFSGVGLSLSISESKSLSKIIASFKAKSVGRAASAYLNETFAQNPAACLEEVHSLKARVAELSAALEQKESSKKLDPVSDLESLYNVLGVQPPSFSVRFTKHPQELRQSRRRDLVAALTPIFEAVCRMVHDDAAAVQKILFSADEKNSTESEYLRHPATQALLAQASRCCANQRLALLSIVTVAPKPHNRL